MEDLHAADISLEALDYIVRRLGPTPILVVGTYRTTEITARHPLARMIEGFQGDRRFARDHARAAVGVRAPRVPRDARRRHRARRRPRRSGSTRAAKGNPFFTKELVRALVDSGGIVKDDSGAWNLSGEAASPPTRCRPRSRRRSRSGSAAARGPARRALGRLGDRHSFDARDLAALAQGARRRRCDRPAGGGRADRGGARVARRPPELLERRRARRPLRGRCRPASAARCIAAAAELLETRHAGRLERVLPQLVQHFFQGDVPDKTVEYGLRLAQVLARNLQRRGGARSATTALDFLDADWEGAACSRARRGCCWRGRTRMAGDIEAALRERRRRPGSSSRRRPARAPAGALLLAAETAWQARRTEEAGRWLEKGLAVAARDRRRRRACANCCRSPRHSPTSSATTTRQRVPGGGDARWAPGARGRRGRGRVRAAAGWWWRRPTRSAPSSRATHQIIEESEIGGQRLRDAARHRHRRAPVAVAVREVGGRR